MLSWQVLSTDDPDTPYIQELFGSCMHDGIVSTNNCPWIDTTTNNSMSSTTWTVSGSRPLRQCRDLTRLNKFQVFGMFKIEDIQNPESPQILIGPASLADSLDSDYNPTIDAMLALTHDLELDDTSCSSAVA